MVAFAAGYFGMLAIKGEFSLTVIKSNQRPAFIGMAEFTTFVVDKFGQLAVMGIAMANQAFYRREFEYIIAVFGAMTEITGGGAMRSP